ncbi:MAG: PQQ-binding-like beta-propeller repeat protein [Pirellulaceae bacterium]
MKNLNLVTLVLLVGFCSSVWATDDWPGWRGKDRRDISKETGLMDSWPEGGPKQVWLNNDAGLGYAGFAVVGDKLFTLGLFDDKEYGLCLDANTGKELWRVEVGDKFKNNWGDGPRNTPTVDEDRVYFLAAGGELVCVKIANQKKLWSISMGDLGGEVPFWGYAESPLVYGDQIVCTPGGDEGAVAALDKMTGKKIWQSKDVTNKAHYSSIIALEKDGNVTYVQLLNSCVVGIDSKSGKVLWNMEFPGKTAVIPTPVEVNGNIYVTSGYGSGSAFYEINGTKATESWMSRSLSNQHGGVVHLDGFIYGFSEMEGFVCQNTENGKIRWNAEKKVAKGALTYADGHLYYIEEKSGDVLLLKVNPEGWEEKGRFKLSPQTEKRSPQGRIWVHPVIANGKMYLRDQELIMCYDVKK